MKVNFNYKKKKIELEVIACNLFRDIWGLMFSRRERAKALMFHFKKPERMQIHSYFVFYPFVCVWLDEEEKVIDVKIVRPWTLSVKPKKSFVKLIEIPINKKYEKIINHLVGDTKSL